MVPASSLADTIDHRDFRVLGAQVEQPRHPVHPRHREIQQDEIGVAGRSKALGQLIERTRLEDLRIVERVADRLAQRAAKQRMVINDNETVARHTVYPCGILT